MTHSSPQNYFDNLKSHLINFHISYVCLYGRVKCYRDDIKAQAVLSYSMKKSWKKWIDKQTRRRRHETLIKIDK